MSLIRTRTTGDIHACAWPLLTDYLRLSELCFESSISILIPPSSIPHLSPLLSLTLPPSHPPPGFDHLLSTSPSSYVSPTTTSSTKPFRLPPTLDLLAVSLTAPSVDEIPAGEAGQRRVGNFLLSSCPGKKVRLNGPVKGRGAICRDLKVDLERIRGLGVGCVVW